MPDKISIGRILKDLGHRFSHQIKAEEFYKDGCMDLEDKYTAQINLVLKLLQLSFHDIIEENSRLRLEARDLNLPSSKRSKEERISGERNIFEDQSGLEDPFSATELVSFVSNPSQHIEETLSQDEDVGKKKSFAEHKKKKKSKKSPKILVPETLPVVELGNRGMLSIPETPCKNNRLVSCLDSQQDDEADDGLSQEIVSSSGEKETPEKRAEEQAAQINDESPIFFRTKSGGDFPESRMKMIDRRNTKRNLESCGNTPGHYGQPTTEDQTSARPSEDVKQQDKNINLPSAGGVGTVTPTIQKKIDRKTWEDLKTDFSGGKKLASSGFNTPESASVLNGEEDYNESPNLLKPARTSIRVDSNSRSGVDDTDKENFKPQKQKVKKPPSQNKWGLTVEPLTESQKKKAKNEKQSTLDMYFNNKGSQTLKRSQSELERALSLSKEEYEAKNTDKVVPVPELKKKKSMSDKIKEKKSMSDKIKEKAMSDKIKEKAEASRKRDEEAEAAKESTPTISATTHNNNKQPSRGRKPNYEMDDYKPPPLTPENFWDPDIVEGDPDDPRNKTQVAPPLRTRALRRKERRLQEQEKKKQQVMEKQPQQPAVEKLFNTSGSYGKRKLLADSDEDPRCNTGSLKKLSAKRKSAKDLASENSYRLSPSDDDFEF